MWRKCSSPEFLFQLEGYCARKRLQWLSRWDSEGTQAWAELPLPHGGRLVIVVEPGRREDEENRQTGSGTSDRGRGWETAVLSVVLSVTLPSHLESIYEIYATSGSGNSVRLPSRLMAWWVQKYRSRDNCGHEPLVVTGRCGKGF